jgi:hypothetical protein
MKPGEKVDKHNIYIGKVGDTDIILDTTLNMFVVGELLDGKYMIPVTYCDNLSQLTEFINGTLHKETR